MRFEKMQPVPIACQQQGPKRPLRHPGEQGRLSGAGPVEER